MSEAEQFVRGNSRLERALSDPATSQRVEKIRSDMAQADREHAMHLASIRKAADLTQAELAQRMGIKQAAVSGLEAREDMLLSTLANYLRAAGASEARVVITIGGQQIEYPLPQPPQQPPTNTVND
jgi:DNA-binding XRE family transcriptional regulator